MKRILLVLTLTFNLVCFAQFDKLELISLQDTPHSNFAKSSLFQSNDSLFYFYSNPSGSQVIYVNFAVGTVETQTFERFQEITFTGLPAPGQRGYDIYQKDDGTFIIARLFFGGQLKLFSYNVTSNTLTQLGAPLSASGSEVEFTYINDSSFIVSIKDASNNVFYYTTTDAASTWSDKQYFTNVSTNNRAVNIDSRNDVLYAALVSEDSLSINLLTSTDLGLSWNFTQNIYTSPDKISNASIHSKGTELYIVFEEYLYVDLIDDFQSDVCYIMSNDNSATWSGKVKYTKFIGDDTISEINSSDSELLVLTLSGRPTSEKLDTYLGELTTTTDPAPPIIYSMDIPRFLHFDENFVVRLFINDETGIGQVISEFDNTQYELFDDGNHSDSLAGDNIYGAELNGYPFSTPNGASSVMLNNISMPLNNKGILGDVNPLAHADFNVSVSDLNGNLIEFSESKTIYSEDGSLGRYKGKGFLFSGGFVLSGFSNSVLWANAVASASLVEDYLPGNVGSSADDPDNLIYSVHENDTPFGETWQNWRKAVQQGAYFYDGDEDGIYDPVDKNSNGQWDADEDKPDMLYDGSYFTVYNDGVPGAERRWNTVDPIGIEIRQTIFASQRNSILRDVFFVRYSLLYKGIGDPSEPDSLSDVIFSVWNDLDIGDATNDRVGCDTLLQAGYTYSEGEDNVWVIDPTTVFKTIVQGPLVKSDAPNAIGYNRMGPDLGEETFPGYNNGGLGSFVHYLGGDPVLMDPSNAEEARNSTLGLIAISGDYPDPCVWNYGEVHNMNCLNVNPKYWYSGDPVSDVGWIEITKSDQRDMTNTEKFTLVKDQPMDILVAYVVGQGTSDLNSITRAREITQYVHEEYARNFSTIVGIEDETEEVINTFSLSQNYPNPFNPSTTIHYTIPNVGRSGAWHYNTKLIVYDILGRQVKTLVNEVKFPGNYEVTFDASQLASGVYFYRLTSGSFIQTKKMMVLK